MDYYAALTRRSLRIVTPREILVAKAQCRRGRIFIQLFGLPTNPTSPERIPEENNHDFRAHGIVWNGLYRSDFTAS
jgi:hypothetical protein